jgi:uncharacterized protein YjiS (DUF1127 family)
MDTPYFRERATGPRAPSRLAEALAWLAACVERSRQRRDLAGLSDALLKDLGLSRAEVLRECGRWPWDGPPAPRGGRSSLCRIRRACAR